MKHCITNEWIPQDTLIWKWATFVYDDIVTCNDGKTMRWSG